MKLLCVFVLAGVMGLCSALPVKEARIEDDPELTAGYIEGDMLPNAATRNGLRDEIYRWPNNKVYYRFNDEIDDSHREQILRGIKSIEDVSCVRFEEAAPGAKIYVNITTVNDGCYSNVGYLGRVQRVNLKLYDIGVGCFRLGTIVHEFLHALGFHHMQSTANRDEYVRIAEENVQVGALQNFDKYTASEIDEFDGMYDYSSVLHYSAFAYTANGEMTIVPLKDENAWMVMGQRRAMTDSDIRKLNIMYRCPVEIQGVVKHVQN